MDEAKESESPPGGEEGGDGGDVENKAKETPSVGEGEKQGEGGEENKAEEKKAESKAQGENETQVSCSFKKKWGILLIKKNPSC